ncbi:MAG: hypothetical protein IBJ14_02120 [Hydrogenophaga sp.]|nr:hypothetical protein [Hydrogenophaga sp.]
MGFVNELVSQQDISTYRLDELFREFSPFRWRNGRPSVFVHAWTVDRGRGAYFIPVKSVETVGPSGRPEPTNGKTCVLIWQERRLVATIDRANTKLFAPDGTPTILVWRLVELDASQFDDASNCDVLKVLKEALTVYGHRGIHKQVPGTIVEFDF